MSRLYHCDCETQAASSAYLQLSYLIHLVAKDGGMQEEQEV